MEGENVEHAGTQIYQIADELFPICRSITGDGVRKTLRILQKRVPEIKVTEVPSGTKVFDWEVPKEWNLTEGYIENSAGKRILDFRENNLHIMGYSVPVDQYMTLEQLKEHLLQSLRSRT